MSRLTPRKLFVTADEFGKLQELGVLEFPYITTDEQANTVAELLEMEHDLVLSHAWHVFVVDEVLVRVGVER